MKQFRIGFENREVFRKNLEEVRNTYSLETGAKTLFYLSWADCGQQEDALYAIEAIEELYPDAIYYGNETFGNIGMGELNFSIQLTATVFESKDTRTELLWVEEGTALQTLQDLWDCCNAKTGLRAIELIPTTTNMEKYGVNGNYPTVNESILIFGGAGVSNPHPAAPSKVFATGHAFSENAIVVVLYFGADLQFSMHDIIGWKALGRLMEVTKSEGKRVYEIDHEPAYSIYEKYLNLSLEDKDTLVFPLMVEEEEIKYLRTPQVIMPDKSIWMFAEIPEGTKIRISYGDKNMILNDIYERAQEIADFQPEGMKAYSCLGRRMFWGDAEISKETRILQEVSPIHGFYTGGEIMRLGSKLVVMNQTLAIVAAREGKANSANKITLTANAPDKSLVSRLAYFTQTVSEEEEREHKQHEIDAQTIIEQKNQELSYTHENMRRLEQIKGLASQYILLYFVNLDTMETEKYYLDDIDAMRYARENDMHSKNYFDAYRNAVKVYAHPDYHEEMAKYGNPEYIKKLMTNRRRYEFRFKLRITSSDIGQWCECSIIRLDGDSIPKSVAFGYTDVTEKVEQELEQKRVLTEALSAAEAANRAKTEFLFNMSHDIRTPMNAILGYADIALRHEDEIERVNDSLMKIKSSGSHLLNLINDILEMSRIESGKLELATNPIDIRTAIKGINQMSTTLAISKDIEFTTIMGEIRNPYVLADQLHGEEVLINLISNAIKYTPEGGKVEWRVEQVEDDNERIARFRFTIKDNGIGMSEEFQRHLFENFTRENTATVSKQEGSGLGLSIVKRIIDLVDGTIQVQSTQGKGTTFTVELPTIIMSPEEEKAFRESQEKYTVFKADSALEGRRILLVEDNEMNCEIVTELLEESKLNIDIAEDGAIALKKVSEKGALYYDYILMDIQMPVMNGYEATAKIRQLPNGNEVPIIALSANAFKEDIEKSIEAGMNAHVAKPIDIDALYDTLRAFLRG